MITRYMKRGNFAQGRNNIKHKEENSTEQYN